MADLNLSVVLTRDWLGLGPLNINDHVSYAVAQQFLGSTVSWNRNQLTSPYMDGSFTASRQRQSVTEQIAVEVFGRSTANGAMSPTTLQANLAALIAAFNQDSFSLTLTLDGTTYSYEAEAADYQVSWVGPRFMARQVQVVFSLPRQPVPLAGGV